MEKCLILKTCAFDCAVTSPMEPIYYETETAERLSATKSLTAAPKQEPRLEPKTTNLQKCSWFSSNV